MKPAKRALALAITALAVFGVGCSSGNDDDAAPGVAVRELAGLVELRVAGQSAWAPVTNKSLTLADGDRVRVSDSGQTKGRAVLRLDGGGSLELRAGSVVAMSSIPVLGGDGLAIAGNKPLRIGAVGAFFDVSPGGAAKLSASLALVAGAYENGVTVSSAGRTIDVPPLRQVDLAAPGLLPLRPSPLVVSAGDEWDRRFLGKAMDFGRDLEQRSTGFTAQARGPATSAETYRELVPGLDGEPAFDDSLLRTGLPTPGERLVGATIALHGTDGSFASRWREAMAFRGEGADWGLVALEHSVTEAPVLHDLELALARFASRLEVASRPLTPAPPGSSPLAPPSTPSSPSPPQSPPATVPPPGSPPPEAPVQLPPIDTGVPILDALVDPLVDTVNGVLNGLLGDQPRP